MIGKVEICGVNTGKLPLLTPQDKDRYFSKIESGDDKARKEYIEGNLRLVLSVVRRFQNRGSLNGESDISDDLFQIGCIGLIKAIDNFDTSLNVRFSTYAVPMIIGEIRRYIRDNSTLRISRSLRETAYKAIYAKEALIKSGNSDPTLQDLSDYLGIPPKEVCMALDAIQCPVSLFEPVYTEGNDTLYVMDQVSDKKNREETWVNNLSLKEALSKLDSREKEIISLRFFYGKTQTEVATLIGISQAQVSRLEKSALRTMRSYFE